MNQTRTAPESDVPRAAGCVGAVVRLLIHALQALDKAGQNELACRIAGEAWSATHHEFPREAQRFNGLLHSLCNTRNPREKGTDVGHQ